MYCDMAGPRFSLYFVQNKAHKVFNKERKQNRHTAKQLLNKAFPAVRSAQNKFVNVKGDKSPYDGDLLYWTKRNSKIYDGPTAISLRRQNHRCGECGLLLTSDERVHLHHIDGNHDNRRRDNLMVVHESCHDYIHMSVPSRELDAGKLARPDLTGSCEG